MRKLLLFLFLIIVLSSSILAVPPIKNPIYSTVDQKLIITIPVFDYYRFNSTNTIHVHVYNTSGKIVTNSSAYCNLHIYNTTHHIYESRMDGDSNGYEFKYDFPSSINNRYGVYSYIIDCNRSNQDFGFIESGFEIVDFTDKNYPITNGENSLSFLIFIPLIMCFFFIFFAWSIPESMEVLRWFARFIGIILLFPTYIIADIMINQNSFFSSLSGIFNIASFTWIFFTLFAILMLSILVAAINGIKKKRNDDFNEGNL